MANPYRELLRQSLRITRTGRQLWWYALVAGFLATSGIGSALAEVSAVFPRNRLASLLTDPNDVLRQEVTQIVDRAQATGIGAIIAISTFALLLLGAILALVWWVHVSVNTLTLGAAERLSDRPLPRTLVRDAAARFRATFAFSVVRGVLATLLLTAWARILISTAITVTPATTALGILAFVITAILLTLLHLLTPFTIAGITLKRRTVTSALREAWALIRSHWLITIEYAALLTVAHLAAVVAILLGSIVLALPFTFLLGAGALTARAGITTAAITIGLTVLIAYVLVVLTLTTTFLTTAWTALYLRLTTPGAPLEPWLTQRRG